MLKFRFPTARRPGPPSGGPPSSGSSADPSTGAGLSASGSQSENQNQSQPTSSRDSNLTRLETQAKAKAKATVTLTASPNAQTPQPPQPPQSQSQSQSHSQPQSQSCHHNLTDYEISTEHTSRDPKPIPNSNPSAHHQSNPIPSPSPSPSPNPSPSLSLSLNTLSNLNPNSFSIPFHSHPSLSSAQDSNLIQKPLPIPFLQSGSPAHQNLFNNSAPLPLTMVSRKTRRKSYGGLRAMLGITRPDDPPPLPTAQSTLSFDHHQPPHSHPPPSQLLLSNLRNHKGPQPSLDDSSPNSSLLSFPPPSPSSQALVSAHPHPQSNNESRPSTSSLRPFPFLGGIRRKSANSNANKLPLPPPHQLPPKPPSPCSSPQVSSAVSSQLESCARRVYTHGSTKKAQSVDDLSQFGLLPKPRLHPRRSEELFEFRQPGPKSSAPPPSSAHDPSCGSSTGGGGLHHGLDAIGAIAGSLAGIKGTSGRADDRQPRLSNPKAMRTVYGVPIEDLFWRDGDAFPLLVDVLVDLIEDKGIDMQGIYRVPGEKRVIENLQASIDERGVRGVNIWKDSYGDVHNLSGLLKLFLREIPGGVVPFDRYEAFLGVNGVEEEARTKLLQSLVCALPLPNKVLLVKLVRHFGRVVAHAESNSMLAHNVAIVFAPSLFRSGSEHSNPLLSMQNIGKASAVVRHLVIHAQEVFGEELLASAAARSAAVKGDANHGEGVEEAGGGNGNGNGAPTGGAKKKKKGGAKGKNRQSVGSVPGGGGGIACLGGAGKKKGGNK